MNRIDIPIKLCISIHALREEGDVYAAVQRAGIVYFYPRPP